MTEHSMHPQLATPPPARVLSDFFSRALASFLSSGSKFHVLCTAPPTPPPGHGVADHDPPTPIPPRSRPLNLIVLDSSFNPPTRAHLRMATSTIQNLVHKEGRDQSTLRLLLLLSVNNADKAAKPAAFDKRLAMMWAFARDVQRELRCPRGSGEQEEPALGGEREESGRLNVDLGLATLPYFHDKSAALAESGFYSGAGGAEEAGQMQQIFLVGFDTLIRIFNPKYYGIAGSPPSPQPTYAEETPMQKALGPFFGRAKLRVTLRADDEWGSEEEQRLYVQSLLRADGLERVGGRGDWSARIEMVEEHTPGVDIISSTYARAAARDRDGGRLELMVSPEVRWWIEQERLYIES